jgi:hypothetical protein
VVSRRGRMVFMPDMAGWRLLYLIDHPSRPVGQSWDHGSFEVALGQLIEKGDPAFILDGDGAPGFRDVFPPYEGRRARRCDRRGGTGSFTSTGMKVVPGTGPHSLLPAYPSSILCRSTKHHPLSARLAGAGSRPRPLSRPGAAGHPASFEPILPEKIKPGNRIPGLSAERSLPVVSTSSSDDALNAGRSAACSSSRRVPAYPPRMDRRAAGDALSLPEKMNPRGKPGAGPRRVHAHPNRELVMVEMTLAPRPAPSLTPRGVA